MANDDAVGGGGGGSSTASTASASGAAPAASSAPTAKRPRSMRTGQRNVLRPNDSSSLWNCTLSPGWTREESDVLRQALLFFGIGNWHKVLDSGCLPGKTNAQLNLQLQRLLGQQSTAEFQGLHLDPAVIGAINAQKQGPDIKRKNGFIVNTGGRLSKEEVKRRIQENKEKFAVPESVWKSIVLPKPDLKGSNASMTGSKMTVIEAKRSLLAKLQNELAIVRNQIVVVRARLAQPLEGDEELEDRAEKRSRLGDPAEPTQDDQGASPHRLGMFAGKSLQTIRQQYGYFEEDEDEDNADNGIDGDEEDGDNDDDGGDGQQDSHGNSDNSSIGDYYSDSGNDMIDIEND